MPNMYNHYIQQQVKVAERIHQSGEKPKLSPCIVFLHELFDALPIYTFEFKNNQWCEYVVRCDKFETSSTQGKFTGFNLRWALSDGVNDNVKNVLQPQKIFKGVEQ